MRQIISNTCNSKFYLNDIGYLPVMGYDSLSVVMEEDPSLIIEYLPPSYAGYFSDLGIKLGSAMVSGSYTIVLYVNRVATNLAITISSGQTAYNFTDRVTVSAGDSVYFYVHGTNNNPVTNIRGYSVVLTPTTSSKYHVWMSSSSGSAVLTTTQAYGHIFTPTTLDTTEANRDMYLPVDGNIYTYRIDFDAAISAGQTVTSTLVYGGATIGNSKITINAGSTSGTATSMARSVGAGIQITHGLVGAASSIESSYALSILFAPTNSGDCVAMAHSTDTLNPAATEYNYVYGGQTLWGAIERTSFVSFPCTIRNFGVVLSGAPGAGTSYTFTLRKNNADSDVSITISGASTSGLASGILSLQDGDEWGISCTPSNTPSAVSAYWYMNIQYDTFSSGFLRGVNTITA